jgi:hypothetical protein
MSDQPVAEAATHTTHYKQTQETNIHALSGIQTRNPIIQAAAYLKLKSYGHRDSNNNNNNSVEC